MDWKLQSKVGINNFLFILLDDTQDLQITCPSLIWFFHFLSHSCTIHRRFISSLLRVRHCFETTQKTNTLLVFSTLTNSISQTWLLFLVLRIEESYCLQCDWVLLISIPLHLQFWQIKNNINHLSIFIQESFTEVHRNYRDALPSPGNKGVSSWCSILVKFLRTQNWERKIFTE